MFRGQLLRVTAGAGDMKNNEMAGKINSELILQDICTRLFAVACWSPGRVPCCVDDGLRHGTNLTRAADVRRRPEWED